MHIVIAPNAFKNSLTAQQAALAISEGLNNSLLDCTSECFPIADGGDGTGELILQKCQGTIINVNVNDPLGRKINAAFGLIDNGKTAVIEMASASGIRLLKPGEPDPLKALSYGTGEMIREALDRGVNKIILAMGGSATVDGGCGILNALGVRFLDENNNALSTCPEHLTQMSTIDTSNLDARIKGCEIVVLCDVDNQLLGDKGAAAVFGPQKGASPLVVKQLDSFLAHFSELILKQYGKDISNVKYGGAAGGATAGIYAFLNAKLVNGIEYFLQLTGFDTVLKKCDLVITGEGSIDSQTLKGKGPFGVANLAKQYNLPVIGVAGSVPLIEDKELKKYFDILLAIGNEPTDLASAINETSANLTRTGTIIGNLLSL